MRYKAYKTQPHHCEPMPWTVRGHWNHPPVASCDSQSGAESIAIALNILDVLGADGHKPEQLADLSVELAQLRKFATEARETLEMVRLANRALERILGEGGER